MIKINISIICFLLAILACKEPKLKSSAELIQNIEPITTSYYFIRHAEKDRSNPGNQNPHLTEAGKIRAKKWAELFKDVDFDAVYSTNFNRTRETAQPIAKKNNLDITIYNPRKMNYNSFLRETKGQSVLIVGHSETTPHFVNKIIKKRKYTDIDDSNFGNYYIVKIKGDIVTDKQLTMP